MGEELNSIRGVTKTLASVFQRFGYQEVETPMFEHLDLFTRKSGSEVVKQLYAFRDKSGRDLALRPELTAPVIRLYAQHLKSAPKPLKLCYFGHCFRYEEPQAFRWRQFYQAGAEVIGSSNPACDVEVILTATEAMRELGFSSWDLRIGNVDILRRALRASGVQERDQDPILRAVDSKDEERIDHELKRAGISGDRAQELKKVFSTKGTPDVLEELPSTFVDRSSLQDFARILNFLRSLKIPFSVDLSIARGLDYYTGVVFEIYVRGVQVAGGGRYDTLVETLGGPPTPATGVGFGVDRLAKLVLESKSLSFSTEPKVMVIPVTGEDVPEAFRIALDFRRQGISTELELADRKLAKSLAHANALGVSYVVLIGPAERAAGRVVLRDMKSGKQEQMGVEEAIKKLKPIT